MEARRAFHGSGNSKDTVVAIVALMVALVLMVMGGLLVKALIAPAATPTNVVLTGQPDASGNGTAWNYSNRRSGTQSVEGPASTAASTSASFREPGSNRGGPQS